MIDRIILWVDENTALAYAFSVGMWIDAPAFFDKNICAIRHAGGSPTVVDDRRQRFQIILLGPRNKRESALALLDDANKLITAAISGIVPCAAANIRAMSEVIGPGYTAENRAWVQVDFEVVT